MASKSCSWNNLDRPDQQKFKGSPFKFVPHSTVTSFNLDNYKSHHNMMQGSMMHATCESVYDHFKTENKPLDFFVNPTQEECTSWNVNPTALGLKWIDIGSERPDRGSELFNDALSQDLAADQSVFTQNELAAFNIHNLRLDDFIKVNDIYFKAAVLESESTESKCNPENISGEVQYCKDKYDLNICPQSEPISSSAIDGLFVVVTCIISIIVSISLAKYWHSQRTN